MKKNLFYLILLLFVLLNCNTKVELQSQENFSDSIYSIREGKVYVRDKEVKKADVSSFEVIGSYCHTDMNDLRCFAKDKNNVYYHGIPLKNANPKEFVFLESGYSKDDSNVYYIYDNKNVVVRGADAASFEVIGVREEDSYAYAKDKNSIYYDGEPLDVDASTFDLKQFKESMD